MRGAWLLPITLLLVAVACSDDDTASRPTDSTLSSPLPTECRLPPFTVTAMRDGESPTGSERYEVVGAAVLPIPLVPDRDERLDLGEAQERGKSTSLLMYSMVFGDEPIDAGELSVFGGYEPTEDHTRGFVSIIPSSPDRPLRPGDVIAPGPAGLNTFTVLTRVGMDFKSVPGELTSYLDGAQGEVKILALTDEAMCLDVDLTWNYSDFSAEPRGALTIRGVFAAPLAPRERYPFE
jgi:hypothetical protein